MKKNSFVLYADYKEHIDLLSITEKATLLDAIFAHVCGTEEPVLEGMAKMAFSFIRSGLDRDAEKYESTCEKRRKAANDRWHKDMQMDANASKSINCNAMHYEGDNDNKTDSDNDDVCDMGVKRVGRGTHTPTREEAESYYLELCREYKISPRDRYVEHIIEYHYRDWKAGMKREVLEDISKGRYNQKPKKEQTAGRFCNFEQRNLEEYENAFDRIINQELEQEEGCFDFVDE